MHIVVVLPTYNERENISILIEKLKQETFPKIKNHDFSILVVDDNSPDGTAQVVNQKINKYSRIFLFKNKEKKGLGYAYMKGFQFALKNLKPDYIVEMDSDLQHRPEDLKKLISEGVDQGYEYIVGSRFMKNSRSYGLSNIFRKFLSVGGSFFIKNILGMKKYTDLTTGFKITKVPGLLENIDLKNIYSHSFAYKIQLYYLAHKLDFKIKEIPIKFDKRKRGVSKMKMTDILDCFLMVFKIRFSNHKKLFSKSKKFET